MRNAHPLYRCYPSVVCVGKPTEVTLFPNDISRAFLPDQEYELCIIGQRDDLPDYSTPLPYDIPCRVVSGCLQFTYTFAHEQEYSIRFRKKGGPPVKLALYAVEQDLYALRPLKGDLHSHSYYSDGTDGIGMTPANFREEGFDFYALTDHNRMFPSLMQQELYADIPLGICMLRGEEVHTPGSALHIVHLGGTSSVCERYVKDPKGFQAQASAIANTLSAVPEQYRFRLASAIWACREIRNAGGLSVFAHPFWQPAIYNVSAEFCDLLFDARIFDAFELFNNGMTHRDNLQLLLWQEQLLKGNSLPVVAGSDTHLQDFVRGGLGRCFTVLFARDNTPQAILQAIRAGYSVAAEVPERVDHEVRIYGANLRLVAFARFLYEHYFSETWRLCVGEGVLMARYARGEEVADALSARAKDVETFYKAFYGLTPAPLLPEKQLNYLARLRKAQEDSGILTCGSKLNIYSDNTRRL